MAHQSTPRFVPTPKPYAWPVRVVGILLLVQACLLVGVALYWLSRVDWSLEVIGETLSPLALDVVVWSGAFLAQAIFLLLVGIAFPLRWRIVWLVAMLLQSTVLFCCLWLYFQTESPLRSSLWLYGLMLYAMLMAPYLNLADVRRAFSLARLVDESTFNPDFARSEGIAPRSLYEKDHEPSDY
jgi:hypothetical protein